MLDNMMSSQTSEYDSAEYDAAIAFMTQFHSRREVTRPSEAPRSGGGGLSSIDERRRNVFQHDDIICLQTNRLVRARTVRCLVELERGEH
jgi:hypothetical protein